MKIFPITLLLSAAALMSAPAFAEQPEWAGKGKSAERRAADRTVQQGAYFDARQRSAANEFYNRQLENGHCPPGLAKKHNGCMPPGQAKKYRLGQPLASNVKYYAVPRPLVKQIGQPPSGYRYVRVSDDILLLELATRKVVDVLLGLGRT
jgi:hypothetical protein